MNPSLTPPLPANLLPFGLECYIAGGYAACPERATDIDVWVQCRVSDNLDATRRQVLSWLSAQGFHFDALEDSRETHVDDYGEMLGGVLKVAKVWDAARLTVHLLVTDMLPLDLISTFDISTHMVAWDGSRTFEYPGLTTELEEEPVVHKDTPTTPARLEKIRNRYADLRTNGEK